MKDYSFVFTSKPIDSSARNALAKGDNFDVKNNCEKLFQSPDPIPTGLFTGNKKDDLTGAIFGRLFVVGYVGRKNVQGEKRNNNNVGRWLVRCKCGLHEIRRTDSLKRKTFEEKMCNRCLIIENFKKVKK